MLDNEISRDIFRDYDIRGIYGKNIDEAVFEKIGNGFRVLSNGTIVVGIDCRTSGPSLKDAFIKGATAAGQNIIDVGLVHRAVAMFWGWKTGNPIAYVSASHLSSEWNGLKSTKADGIDFGTENAKIYDIIKKGDFVKDCTGSVDKRDVTSEYKEHVKTKMPRAARNLKVLLDCGNGTACPVAKELFADLGYTVDTIFEEPDGNFPNRESDIKDDGNLTEAIKRAPGFDMTVAYDGDGDRMVLIDDMGRVLKPEQTAYLILSELLKRERGPVIANVECSDVVDKIAKEHDSEVKRSRVGYNFVIKEVYKTGGCFGMETSGHYIIPSIIPLDDAVAVSLYAAYALSASGKRLSDFVDSIPPFVRKYVNFDLESDSEKFSIMKRLEKRLADEKASRIDGLKIIRDDGWVLIRPSNTSPVLRLTVEVADERKSEALIKEFTDMIKEETGK
jgi:phosphomannomutase